MKDYQERSKIYIYENGLDVRAMLGVEKVLVVENTAARHILSNGPRHLRSWR